MSRGGGPGTLGLWLRAPMWGLHAIGALAVVVCLVGGTWQLGVYDDRQQHERADRRDVPAVAIEEAWTSGDAFTSSLNHRPVDVTGTFGSADEQRWVSGRAQDGESGYWLLAPLVMDGDEAILVVRGFSTDDSVMPEPPPGQLTVRVVLEPGEPASTDDSTRTAGDSHISSVRVPTLVNELPYTLFPGFGISTDEAVAGRLELADIPTLDVEWTVGLRNLAYSMQWWAFGAFALFMWVRMGADLVATERARRDCDPDDSLNA